ncbi:hypothetical protein [Spiroplasma endosymbiont of Lonchoptera lutea]|uniref:hypothetical protein n=1 Tax=Spiroplasma endosymbiont of Lonchoptera lutea TaxID=3066297 RepID=UPI0030CD117C
MKKLLAILGTITISGNAIACLVGNAPAPTKNEINSLQTNNLETLNRNKRDLGATAIITGIAIGLSLLSSGVAITDSYNKDGVAKKVIDGYGENYVRGAGKTTDSDGSTIWWPDAS